MQLWAKYLSKLNDAQSESITQISQIVQEIEPKAEIALPYGVPGFKYKNKNLIAFAAHKNHFGVYPFSPSIVKEIVKDNPKIDFAEGTLRFSYSNLPKSELIEQLIRLRKNDIS